MGRAEEGNAEIPLSRQTDASARGAAAGEIKGRSARKAKEKRGGGFRDGAGKFVR